MDTTTGPATVDLLNRLLVAAPTPSIVISGCSASSCSQEITLTQSYVTGVDLGSPLVLSKVGFDYATILWKRIDAQGSVQFGWNLAASKPI